MPDYRVQPSKSKKQHDFMEAVAHSPSFAKKAGVSQDVGKDYAEADKSEGKYQNAASTMANQGPKTGTQTGNGLHSAPSQTQSCRWKVPDF